MNVCENRPVASSPKNHQRIAALARRDSLCGRLMRVCIFQMASANEGWLESLAFKWRWNQLHQVKCCLEEGRYIPARCRESERILSDLGGEKFSVIPRDREAVIQGMYFDPAVIKDKIAKLGGCWEKIHHGGQEHFAIRAPKVKTQDWNIFADKTLCRMGWKTASWDQDLIITAENVGNAPSIGKNEKCVLIIEVTVPGPMQRKEIGKFIGLGCRVAINNARGIVVDPKEIGPKTGLITEAACHEDLNCVMDYLHKNKRIDKSSVILRGNCLNAAIAIPLIAEHAKSGICAFLDNVPMSPREILQGHPKMIRFYDANIAATQSLASSPLRQSGIPENGFNAIDTIHRMPVFSSSASKVLMIGTLGDFATPPEKVEQVYNQLKNKLPSSGCEYFCQDPSLIPGGENLSAHLASSIRNPGVQSLFLRHFGMSMPHQC